MNEWALLVMTAAAAYLIGATPFGYLVARWRGVDIFQHGSGNIGATNVGRILGRKFGVLVFVLDFLKGAGPVAAATAVSHAVQPQLPPDTIPVAAGVAAFLGHLFPVYLRFRGGKGVATGAGALAVLLPIPAGVAVLTWLVVASSFAYVSLASLAAALVLTLFRLAATPLPFARDNAVLTLFCVFATVLVFVRHQANIRGLLAGRENRLEDTPTMNALCKILHVVAVGLWFGMASFFSFVVAFSLFGNFEREAEKPRAERKSWFPVAPGYDRKIDSDRFPDPTRKEQGTRAAGFAIAPLFDSYFVVQTACGLVALITSFAWRRVCGKAHKARVIVIALAVVTIGVGWWLEKKVSDLRVDRDGATETVLNAPEVPSKEIVEAAEKARKEFGMWHGMAMGLNLLTVLLVATTMGLAAFLPSRAEVCPATGRDEALPEHGP